MSTTDPRTDVPDDQDIWVEGADWETLEDAVGASSMTVNMGPQHPSTHGVLRLVLRR